MQNTRKIVWFILFLYYLIHHAESATRIDALVDTKVGLIRGLQATDGDYAMFMGIPYAKVEEDNPFGPSVPFPLFDETFEAYDDSAVCLQMNFEGPAAVGSLDCLHLNVYVPNIASSENRLPVMVWIYGGAFITGSFGRNLYGPKNLVKHDVILVTVNYRVGPYGFMCLDNPKVPGNQGLKDQQLALRWVKENIEAFGGNANEITIFGESAGGVSVDLHYYYTKEKLFNKVIAQSGNALCPWAVTKPDSSIPSKIAKHLGFKSEDIDEILSFLSVTTPELVIAASNDLNLEYRPCLEKDFKNVEKFIGEYPINTDTPNDYPIMLGHNDKETLGLLNYDFEFVQNVFRDSLEQFFNLDSDELVKMEQYIRNFYIGDETVSNTNAMAIVDYSSDLNFNYPTVRSVNRYLKNGAKSVFYYVFTYTGEQNFGHYMEPTNNMSKAGASHTDELGYLFHQSENTKEPIPADQLMIDQITTLWTNFAKTGNPTPEESDLIPLVWSPASETSLNYLDIGSELSVKRKAFHDRMAFWDLFYELNEKAQRGYADV